MARLYGTGVNKIKLSVSIIGVSAISLAGFIALAMTTNLRFVNLIPKPAAETSKLEKSQFSAQATSPNKKLPAGTENSFEGKLTQVHVTVGPFDIHRRYRSMEGPYVSFESKVGDMVKTKNVVVPPHFVEFVEGGSAPSMNGGPTMKGAAADRWNSPVPLTTSTDPKTLYWAKGIKLIVLDENDKPLPTAEFICHANVNVVERGKVFPGSKTTSSRLFTLTQGQTDFHFPNGFAVPLSSKEKLQFNFQAANRTTSEHRRLKHFATIDFIKDSDLQKELKPLGWYTPYCAVILNREASQADMSHHGPNCLATSLGESAPNAVKGSVLGDSKKHLLNGHWVVPPGIHTYTSPIDDERDAGFNSSDRIVHAVWSHMHPLCTEMSLNMCDGEKKTPMWKVNVETDASKGLEIKHIDNVYSTKGILLPKNMHYEISGTYNNNTVKALDSMLSFGIYFEDPSFVKPDWSHETPDNLPDRGKSFDFGGTEKFALFNDVADGPLLTEKKHLNVTTSAGDIHLTLNPEFAPKHATQIYKLFRSGTYDGTTIFNYNPNFIFQIGSVELKHDHRQRLADLQAEEIRRLPLEVEKQDRGIGRNKKYALSMCRAEADDSATSSFSILLANASHLNNQYTVFGNIEPDDTTLATLEKMKRDWGKKEKPYIICATEDSTPTALSTPEVLASSEENTSECKLYCGIKPTKAQQEFAKALQAQQSAKIFQIEQNPRFDIKKDGPLLTESKNMEIKTSAGNIHLVIDPSLASKNATQMYRLFKAGAFKNTTIARYEKDFVLQISLAQTKLDPAETLSTSVHSMIRRLPLEVSNKPEGSHKKFALSMAHEDNDLNSATSSFSIILGSAPHLDKKYTVFGHVVDDLETQKTIAKIEAEFSKEHPPRIINVTDRAVKLASVK